MRATTPILFLRSDISSTGTVLQLRDEGIEVRTMEPTIRPTGIADSRPMGGIGEDPSVAIGEGVDSMGALAFIPQDQDPFRLLRALRRALHPDSEAGSSWFRHFSLVGSAGSTGLNERER